MSSRLVAAPALSPLLVAGIVLAVGGTAAAQSRTATARPAKTGGFATRQSPLRVALYGDSLASEAQDVFVATVTGTGQAEVRTGTYGGTAPCDWFEQMRQDAAAWRPRVVVVEFSGNVLTPCMKEADGRSIGGEAYFERYASDARVVVEIFSAVGARVYFAGSPISRAVERSGDFNGGRLNSMYRTVPGAGYVDAGAAVLAVGGRYADRLPCLPEEPCTGPDGTNLVRAPDGAHFCPGGDAAKDGVTGACTVWSSGAYRYARAMAEPALRYLRPNVATPYF